MSGTEFNTCPGCSAGYFLGTFSKLTCRCGEFVWTRTYGWQKHNWSGWNDPAVLAATGAPSSPVDFKAVSAERKASPLFSGCIAYFHDALNEVARLSRAANEKHNPGEPMHWARGKSTDHADCITRHQVDWDQIDDEDGFYHAVKVAWRSLAQLQELLEKKRGLPMSRGSK